MPRHSIIAWTLSIGLLSSSAYGQVDTSAYNLEGVEVRADANATSISSKDPNFTVTIGRKELEKAACCNLSESFETNPNIDVAFTDAVTGTKHIKMFGLAGKYAQIQAEMTPLVRGLLSNSGLTFIPGTWVESIQLTQGIGSVTNGYESMTGQINIELLKPEELAAAAIRPGAEGRGDLLLNIYGNQGSRGEMNVAWGKDVHRQWAIGLLGHASTRNQVMDRNADGFSDMPVGHQINGMLRARFFGDRNTEGLFTIQALDDLKVGGQLRTDQPNFGQGWQSALHQQRLAYSSKTGWVSETNPENSIGLIVQFHRNLMEGRLGSELTPATQWNVFQSQIGGLVQLLGSWHLESINWDHRFGTQIIGDQYITDFHLGNPVAPHNAWREQVAGIFSEWSKERDASTVVIGGRVDYHNVLGWQFSPRLHLRYALSEFGTLRINTGRGFRLAMPLTESYGLLASQRALYVDDQLSTPTGDNLESAWNLSSSYVRVFEWNYRPGTFTANAQYSHFTDAVIHDLWTPGEHHIYRAPEGQDGGAVKSSISAGTTLDYSLSKHVDLRGSYRWQDSRSNFMAANGDVVNRTKPFVSQHRGLLMVSYHDNKHWLADLTTQLYSPQYLPLVHNNEAVDMSPAFTLLHAQVAYEFTGGRLYCGVENILDQRQTDPIQGIMDAEGNLLDPTHPTFQAEFDATRVWGPIFGRTLYLGMDLSL